MVTHRAFRTAIATRDRRFRSLARGACVCGVLLFAHHSSDAAPPTKSGEQALAEARTAWNRGAIQTAETRYREALEKGGLEPAAVVEGYVRLGTIRARTGRKDPAIAAFRAAAVLDAAFVLPPSAGSKAISLAERAKQDTSKIGSLRLSIAPLRDVRASRTLRVSASLDKAHVPMVHRIAMQAKDAATGKEVAFDTAPDESVEFEIGPDMTLTGANVSIRVDALDSRRNRLASAETSYVVSDLRDDSAVASPARAASGSTSTSASRAKSASWMKTPAPVASDTGVHKSRSFWSSPWPYVIGGAALVGASAAVFFGTQSPDRVSVGPVQVRVQ